MNNSIQIFNFKNNEIREITDEQGNPWFIAKDITDILEMPNGREAVRQLDDDEKSSVRISDGGPKRSIINESGLYTLILKSRKPEAKTFKKWVTSEVLPSIRKTGSYSINIPQTYPEALRALADEVEKREAAQRKVEVLRPKAAIHDQIIGSEGYILPSVAGKIIMGSPNKFVKWLVEDVHVLFRSRGKLRPIAAFQTAGHFVMREVRNDNQNKVYDQVYFTPRGMSWITDLWNSNHLPLLPKAE